jgi:hypothetical protein
MVLIIGSWSLLVIKYQLYGRSRLSAHFHHQRADRRYTAIVQLKSLAGLCFTLYNCKMTDEYVTQPLCAASFATR